MPKRFSNPRLETQEHADKAAIWSRKLSQIANKATDLHKQEKRPYLDAGRAVDNRWRFLKDEPKELSIRLKRHLDSWLREQVRIEEERRKKAEAEAEAEAAEAEKQAETRNVGVGRTGARVSLRTFVSAEITDYAALLEALKDRPEIRELVQSLANRAAKSGVELPGMKIHQEKRAT